MTDRTLRIERLRAGDEAVAKTMFAMMSAVFELAQAELSTAYVAKLLAREDMWILAARSGEEIVGGLTAHTLPMTRSESCELFIYDVAVRVDHQRRGVGRALMNTLQHLAEGEGMGDVFVPADNEDQHALEFYRAVGGDEAPVTFFTFSPGEQTKS